MLPLGITKKELLQGTRFTYSELSIRAGLNKTDFTAFICNNDFSSYYKNRYPGDLDKLMVLTIFVLIL